MIAIEHALALLIVVGFPLWDVLETRALKGSTNPRRKIMGYQRLVSVLWLAAIVICATMGWTVFFVWPEVHQSVWQRINAYLVWGVVLAWIAWNLVRSYRRRHIRLRETTRAAFQRLDFFLPATGEERKWFAVVSVTAGICEEILYRGFLICYFAEGPWHTGLVVALVISSVAFGLAHSYQGV